MRMRRDTSTIKWISFVAVLFAIYLFGWVLQSFMIFSWDVAWLVEASKRMVAGGSYAKDFFENNPPLILYLYSPVVLLSSVLNGGVRLALQIYVYAIATLSLVMCYFQARTIFQERHSPILLQMVVVLAGIYLLLPMFEFGQREHLFVMLTMPYYFLMTLRLQDKQVSRYNAGFVGVLAGLGFFIKPVFVLCLLMAGAYFLFRKRNIRLLLQTETLSILLLLALYLLVILLRHMDYLSVVLPYVAKWCYANISLPWEFRIVNHYTLYCLAVVLFCLSAAKRSPYCDFHVVLSVVTLGSILLFVWQGSNWYYRMLPMLSFTVLLLSTKLTMQARERQSLTAYILMGLFAGLAIMLEWFFTPAAWAQVVLSPSCFYVYCLLLLMLVNSMLPSAHSVIIRTAAEAMVLFLIIGEIIKSGFASDLIYVAGLLLVVIFYTLSRGSWLFRLRHAAYLGFAFIFCLPLYLMISDAYSLGRHNKLAIAELVTYLDTQVVNKRLYVFSTELRYLSAVNESHHVTLASRFSHFIGLGGLVTQAAEAAKDKEFLISMIVDDLTSKKPEIVLVDISREKRSISYDEVVNHHRVTHYLPFDYIRYFSTSENFRHIWKSYSYKGTTDHAHYAIYQLDQHG